MFYGFFISIKCHSPTQPFSKSIGCQSIFKKVTAKEEDRMKSHSADIRLRNAPKFGKNATLQKNRRQMKQIEDWNAEIKFKKLREMQKPTKMKKILLVKIPPKQCLLRIKVAS